MAEESVFSLDPVAVPRVETGHRRIVTAFPAPGTRAVMERIARIENSSALGQMPVIWDRAEGHRIFDPWGNCWIDFTSSIFVTNCGHAHPHLVAAVKEQSERLQHAYCYPTGIRARYLEKLVAFTPAYLDKVSLFSTGTEASERAIKFARLYGQKDGQGRRTIVGWDGNFHGKTMGAQMAGGYHEQKTWIGHLDPEMVHLPFPYPWVMEQTNLSGAELFHRHIEDLAVRGVDLSSVVALMLESYQGWGGIFYPQDYVQAARAWSKERDALLIFDEIQAGFGRTGTLFAYEHYAVEPDVVVCGKGISGGFPLSAVLARGDIIDLDGAYTSTNGGHPVGCAAGLANIEIFERENLIAETARKEGVVAAEVARWKERFPHRIGRVLGRGLLWGIFITKSGITTSGGDDELDPVFCDRIVERCLRKGVFNIRTGRGTLKLGPPLTIPDDALVEGLRVIEEAIGELIDDGF